MLEFIDHVGGKLDSSQNYLLLKGFDRMSEEYISPYYQFESNKLQRGFYGLAASKNQYMSRQDVLAGMWRSTHYTNIVIDLFKNNSIVSISPPVKKHISIRE